MSNNKDYEVGYKRPPKVNQFKKGHSGNPKVDQMDLKIFMKPW